MICIRLEPLLSITKESPRRVVCPTIDRIDHNSLGHSGSDGLVIGGFLWQGSFMWWYRTADGYSNEDAIE